MLAFLKEWIINIVTISMVLILFEIIIPTGKVKKIIHLVSGFVLLIAVINPFLSLKNHELNLNDKMLADSYYLDKKEMETSGRILEERQIKQITELYKQKLAARIQEETGKIEGVSGVEVELVINEDYGTDKFGEINQLYIELRKVEKQHQQGSNSSVAVVKKVDIQAVSGSGKNDEKPKKVTDTGANKLAEQVRTNLGKALEIQQENIVVTVVE